MSVASRGLLTHSFATSFDRKRRQVLDDDGWSALRFVTFHNGIHKRSQGPRGDWRESAGVPYEDPLAGHKGIGSDGHRTLVIWAGGHGANARIFGDLARVRTPIAVTGVRDG
jgi:hypothetical protein